jgi:hypothetical protein
MLSQERAVLNAKTPKISLTGMGWQDVLTKRSSINFLKEKRRRRNGRCHLAAKVYFRLLQHGKDRSAGAPDIVTPVVTPALLSREGFLYPTPATSIPRDLLEPLPKGIFDW